MTPCRRPSYSTVGHRPGILPGDRLRHPWPHPCARGQQQGNGHGALCRARPTVLGAPQQHRPYVGELEQQWRDTNPPRLQPWASHSFVFADVNGIRVKRALSTVFDAVHARLRIRRFISRRRHPAGAAVKTCHDHDEPRRWRRRKWRQAWREAGQRVADRALKAPRRQTLLGMDPDEPRSVGHTWS